MGLAGVGIAATVASTAVGLGTSLAKSGAVSRGQSQANAAQTNALGQAENQLGPWATTGVPANADQADLLGLNGPDAANAAMAKFQTSPGYQFQLQQGLRAVDAGAAAHEMLRSGATLKAEQTFGQGLADSDFGNYWNRLNQLSESGRLAAGGLATGEIQTGQGIAGTDASAAAGQSSIYGGLGTGVSNNINQLANNTAVQNWLTGGGTPALGTAGGFNQGRDLVNPDGSVVLPPTFQPPPAPTGGY